MPWQSTPVLLPGKSDRLRGLVGCSPWGCWESDTTERLHFHFSLSWIGEGNGNPLQCSCLENPRDGGAWWAAVHGVAQSWTWLKRLSSSSSSSMGLVFIMLSEINQTEKDKYHILLLAHGILKKWYKWTYLQTETDSQTEKKFVVIRGERWGKDRLGVWDWHVHSAICKIENQQWSII